MGAPAEEFGPYVVYEQIGLGGMATVHRAEAQGIAGFSKQVALKRMLPNVATDASLVKSFIREARLASHMRHANVAQTYDLGKVGETYFIAMELVPGRNLREILEHCSAVVGPMPVAIALNIVGQICDALDYAHNLCDETGQPLGIIHRDVSPANIIVSEGGVVKLIDFGIAKAAGGVHTQTGTIKGKCAYMAPEYLMGSSIDARADLFAVGVIAHELLANRPLFQGKDDMDTLYRLKDMPILPPSRINPEVPPELDAVVTTALDRDPDRRWQRASALRSALLAHGKALGLYAPDSQVFEWIEWAFRQKPGQFDERSEPAISISTGTMQLEMPRGTRPGNDVVPRDEFSPESDSLDTHVRPTGSKPIQQQQPPGRVAAWSDGEETGATTEAARARDVPTQPLRPSAQLRAVPEPASSQRPQSKPPARQDLDKTLQDPRRVTGFEDDQPTVAAGQGYQHALLDGKRGTPGGDRNAFDDNQPTVAAADDYEAAVRDSRPSLEQAARRAAPRTDRAGIDDGAPQQPPPRASRPSPAQPPPPPPPSARPSRPSQAQPPPPPSARTSRPSQPAIDVEEAMRSQPRASRPSQPAFDVDDAARTQPQRPSRPDQPAVDDDAAALPPARPARTRLGHAVDPRGAMPQPGRNSTPSLPLSGARTTPHLEAARDIIQAPLDADLGAVLDELAGSTPPAPSGSLARPVQGSSVQTRVEAPPRGASRFLLAVLVLAAAAGAAGVVYFVLPYLA